MKSSIAILAIVLLLVACNTTKNLPSTLGDQKNAPNYGYTPLDPLPAYVDSAFLSAGKADSQLLLNILGNSKLANLLSDETIRMAVGTIDAKANVSFAANTIGVAGSSYVVIMDYIKYISLPMFAVAVDSGNTKTISALDFAQYNKKSSPLPGQNTEQPVVMPLYVGVGLRITANVTVKSGTLSLGNLFGIGASGSLNQASGTLSVQTLGITGDGISALIPMPSDLNTTTIQNAILSLGQIKAKMYEPSTILSPRVLGFYNNVGGIGTVITNKVISSVLTKVILVRNSVGS